MPHHGAVGRQTAAPYPVTNPNGICRVGRSYISRVKAEGVLETRRGSILVRNGEALGKRTCQCNEAVKNHFEEVLRAVYPTEEAQSA